MPGNKNEIKILLLEIEGISSIEADMLISKREVTEKDKARKIKIENILNQLKTEEK